MAINDPDVLAEFRELYLLNETVIVNNDVEKLVEMF